jgi:hypothetical protein
MTHWFDPGLMDRLKLVLVTLLKHSRTNVTKITMSTFSIIEALNVIKDIISRLLSGQVARAINALTFQ